MNKNVRQVVLPLIAAFIWGSAFIAQGMVTDKIGPFSFNALRSLIAAALLLILCVVVFLYKKKKGIAVGTNWKNLIWAGSVCGILLFVSSNLQQYAIQGNLDGSNNEGIVAFITAFYMILVPIIELILGKRTGVNVWIAAAVGVVGLYFISVKGSLEINLYNLAALGCAIVFAFHIVCVSVFTEKNDCFQLSCAQFIVNFVLSAICAIAFESISYEAVAASMLPILYIGVFSSTIGYTLQIVAQKGTNPTVVSVIMCLESVFAVLIQLIIGLIYPEKATYMSTMQYVGCALMMSAVIIAQFDFKKNKNEIT